MQFANSLIALIAAAAVSAVSITKREPQNDNRDHSPLKVPNGARLRPIRVNDNSHLQTYWTASPNNNAAKSAFIIIHGRRRDGNTHWTVMNDILKSAVQSNYGGAADPNAIVIAPQFFSRDLNAGQYTDNQMSWGEVNTWQAGEAALTPAGNRATSFDAIDAILAELADKSKYPSMQRVVIAGSSGGAQMTQRLAAVGKDAPAGIRVRYIHSSGSSAAYFTRNRPKTGITRAQCPGFNTWRYGFDGFKGTAEGLGSPKEYFRRYITRDVVCIVGQHDTQAGGDQGCEARMQGGTQRDNRKFAWYKYINMLARTSEDVSRFYGDFGRLPDWSDVSGGRSNLRLVVVPNVAHNVREVFSSREGMAALFSTGDIPTGWRP